MLAFMSEEHIRVWLVAGISADRLG